MPKSMLTAGMLSSEAEALSLRARHAADHELGADAAIELRVSFMNGFKAAARGNPIPVEPTKARSEAAEHGYREGIRLENPERRKAVHA